MFWSHGVMCAMYGFFDVTDHGVDPVEDLVVWVIIGLACVDNSVKNNVVSNSP
ncbi:hypothetical protein [Desulfosediminicola sp.]|uniref:hypothetical protein n=1 Tax=Desulfosediminicola sp. TaxID=2886825 RepID=UPI003AF2DAD0